MPGRKTVNEELREDFFCANYKHSKLINRQRRARRTILWSSGRQSFKHSLPEDWNKERIENILELCKDRAIRISLAEDDALRPKPKEFNFPEDVQEIYDEAYAKYWNLNDRVSALEKSRIRAMHLAYGFLNGLPYAKIESDTRANLNFFKDRDGWDKDGQPEHRNGFLKQVKNIARRYSEIDIREFEQSWAEWTDGLYEHVERVQAQREEKRKLKTEASSVEAQVG